VERYALRSLGSLLLFPYRPRDGRMELVSEDELGALPRTWDYLRRNEAELRGRERGKMDHEGWWAFGRTQSLGLHDRPKLGVAATVQRLEVAADPAGAAYFHNVRVNGILPRDGSIGLFALLAVLNSRPVDFAFRRAAAPLQNGFFTANKQFISWLPIPELRSSDLDQCGQRLFELATVTQREHSSFLDWLASVCGTSLKKLDGRTKIEAYARSGRETVLDVLDANASRLKIDPRSRTHRERISAELDASSDRIASHRAQREQLEQQVDALLMDLYKLTAAQRRRVDSEY